MVKKRSSKHQSSSGDSQTDDATTARAASKSPSPVSDQGAIAQSPSPPPPGAEGTPEKKKSWFKRLFSGKNLKRKEGMKRTTSEPTAVQVVTSDNSLTDREALSPGLATLREIPRDHSASRGISTYSSSPSLMPTFRKRPVTVHVADDVWAQVQAKQEVMFRDTSLLKADAGVMISSRTPPVHRHSHTDEDNRKSEKFEITDEEWQKVKTAQNKMFSKSDESANPEEISTSKPSSDLSHEVEDVVAKKKPKEASVPVTVVSSAEQVKAALAKKEEEEKARQKLAAETLAKRLSTSKEEEKEEDLEQHEFFAECTNKEENVDENIEEHEFFAAEVQSNEPKEEEPSKKFSELLRKQSLKLHQSRETKRQKRHTVAAPEFLEGEDTLWEEIHSKHASVLGDVGTKPARERLDDKEVDVTENELFADVKIRKSGVVVERKKSDSARPSILPSAENAEVSVFADGNEKPRIDSGYLSADLTAIPLLQPSLGLSAGHMKRNVSRKHKRRPPSVRSPPPQSESQDSETLFTYDSKEQSEVTEKSAAEEKEEPVANVNVPSTEEICPKASDLPAEEAGPRLQSQKPTNWLQELQRKQLSKTEGIGSSATLPYKKKSDPGSTAALVAIAAKRKTSQESFVSFNERQNKPKPRAMVIHEKFPAPGEAPEWMRMAKRMSDRRVSQNAK